MPVDLLKKHLKSWGLFCLLALVQSPVLIQAATPQTITFAALPNKTTTDAAFPLAATASSGLAVSYSITSPAGVATVSGGTVTLTGTAGAATVRASQAGNGAYAAAPEVYRSFMVGTASQRFVKVARSSTSMHSAGIRGDGTLWTWGSNWYGQLGIPINNFSEVLPKKVGTATTWTAVACGEGHTVALRSDGTLWTWGRNDNGQLGSGNTTSRSTATQVGSVTTWAAVACGVSHTVALRSDGTLWAWGLNSSSQLGDGGTTQRTAPVQIGTATTWSAVSCGAYHTLALRSNGTLWAWGDNQSGQVGKGVVVGGPTTQTSPVQIGTATTWTAVSGGFYHSLALRSNGTLWAWGASHYGQLGDGTAIAGNLQPTPAQVGTATTWSSVFAAGSASLALRTDGTLWGWGYYGGFIQTTSTAADSLPAQIGTATDWSALGGGVGHVTALGSGGSLYSWGDNTFAQLGTETASLTQATPAQVGAATGWSSLAVGSGHVAVLHADRSLWTWGSNSSGQLGDGTTTTRITLQQIGSDTWRSVVAGTSHTAAIRTDGTLWAWGDNNYRQLGDGTTTNRPTPVQIGTSTLWTTVACGTQHTAAVRSDGTLWAWGDNNHGQLGDGSGTNRPSPVQIGSATTWAAVACGGSHTVALRSDGTLWAWGDNNSGQLGDGTTSMRSSPVKIGTATTWTRVVCGTDYTLALRSDGTLWAWGENSSRQLGDGTTTDRPSPVQTGSAMTWSSVACGRNAQVLAVRADGTLWIWGAGASPTQTGTATNWAVASADSSRFVALRTDGTLWAWGTSSASPLNHELTGPALVWPARTSQALTFPALASLTQGQPVTLAATASSGLPVSYTAVGPATLSGSVLTPTGAGAVTIAVYQYGSPSWVFGESAMQTVTAQAATPQQSWRQTHFGTSSNSGSAADSADADNDGLANLVEYAFGLSPTTGSSSQLPQPQQAAGSFTVTFPQPAGVTGVTYGASYSPSLTSGSWTPVPDTGSGTTHIFSVPVGTGDQQMFIRLEVTAAP